MSDAHICKTVTADPDARGLHEIALEDIDLAAEALEGISWVIGQMRASNAFCDPGSDGQTAKPDPVACKSFWVEKTLALLIYIWNDIDAKAIIVPKSGWALRSDVTIH